MSYVGTRESPQLHIRLPEHIRLALDIQTAKSRRPKSRPSLAQTAAEAIERGLPREVVAEAKALVQASA
jgi:hypothetical protein